MERAASEPPKLQTGLGVVNPFYSERNKTEIALRASRPSALPEQSPEEGALPLLGEQSAGVCTGKGRGGQASGKLNVFETPPPSRTEAFGGDEKGPKRTQGTMPVDDVATTWVPTGMGRKTPKVAETHDDLQRALEAELVNHLRAQNSQLMDELERMRAVMSKSGNGSNSSWSEIGGVSACAGIPPEGVDDGERRRGDFQTPRSSSQRAEKGKQDVRFTPNGTRIPDGTPPDDSTGMEPRHVPQPPPERPCVPPFPQSFMSDDNMDKFLDSYDKVESAPKCLKVKHTWEPNPVMSPRAARAFWLEQEVVTLRGSLAKLADGNTLKSSEYWSKGFHPPTGPPVAPVSPRAAACPDQRLQDRASRFGSAPEVCQRDLLGGCGEINLQDRARTLSRPHNVCPRDLLGGCGETDLQDRAGTLSNGPKEFQGHLLGGGGDERLQDRALSMGPHIECLGGHLPHQARALHGGAAHPHDCGPDRFTEYPRHGVGGGGPGDGRDRVYGPWTEGGSMNTRSELPDLAEGSSPLQFGDWLHLAGPIMKDLSGTADWWWESTLREAKCYYEQWKTSSPLARIQIRPRLPEALCEQRFLRTEHRGIQMLLKAIPTIEQQELVTDRALSSTAILYKLMVRYQPGGAGEKQILLQQLTSMPKLGTVQEVAAALRNWRRHYGRAQEVEAVLPDGVLLVKALDSPLQKIAALDQQAAFRLSQSRMQLQLDERPVHNNLWAFSQCLLAEAETLCLMATSTATTPQTPLKLKQMQSDPKTFSTSASTGDKARNSSTSDKPCKYFISDAGCKAGRSCKWLHSWDDVPDRASRCWICGGKDHRKNDCKLRPAGKKSGDPASGSGGGRGGDGVSHLSSTSPAVGGKAGAAAASKSSISPGIKELKVPSPGDGKGSASAPEVTSSTSATVEDKGGRNDNQVEEMTIRSRMTKPPSSFMKLRSS